MSTEQPPTRWPALDLSNPGPPPFPDLDEWPPFQPSPGLVMLAAVACELVPLVPKIDSPLRPRGRVPDGEKMLEDLACAIGLLGTTAKDRKMPTDDMQANFNLHAFNAHINEWSGNLYDVTRYLKGLIADEVYMSLKPGRWDGMSKDDWQIRPVTDEHITWRICPVTDEHLTRLFEPGACRGGNPGVMATVLKATWGLSRMPLRMGYVTPALPVQSNLPRFGLWGFATTRYATSVEADFAGATRHLWGVGIQGMWQNGCEFVAVSHPAITAEVIEGVHAMMLAFAKGWAVCQGMTNDQRRAYAEVMSERIRHGLNDAKRSPP